MAKLYNAGEVFEMALEIERNGERFYRQAAGAADDPEIARALDALAEMESDHAELFARLKGELPADASPAIPYDPDGDVARYLRAAADNHVFNVYRDEPQHLSEKRAAEDILGAALQFEKDTVVFFLGIREMVPPELGRSEVDQLIKEEMAHIVDLTDQLERLRR
ncbi:MAG: ferritin family protein [Candidatus Brocadiaceae bacterium]|jgi:rubrerythrin